MEDAVKTRAILILGILSAILLFSTISANFAANKCKADMQKELGGKIAAEEKLDAALKEKSNWQANIDNLQKQLDGERAAKEAGGKSLAQEQLVNQSLRDELEKVTKLKEKLEENLKDVLVSKPESKKK